MRVGKLGGLGVLNAEGLWARHPDPPKALRAVVEAAGADDPLEAVRTLQELHAAPIRPDLLAVSLGVIRDAGVVVAARVSPQRARELTPDLLAAGVEILVVQGTIISAEHVSREEVEPLNLKEFIADLDIPVVAGGVGDYRTTMHLMRTGAAGVIVGYGQSSATTTDEVLGIGVPMATAIVDAAAARRDYLDETGGRYVHVIADGGIDTSGEVAKAIACGADAVMLGEQLADSTESPAARALLDRGGGAPVAATQRRVRVRRRHRGPGDSAVRAVVQPVRPGQPVRRAAPVDGEDRVQRPQGVPARRPCGAGLRPRSARPVSGDGRGNGVMRARAA